jgi:hypothetical protein
MLSSVCRRYSAGEDHVEALGLGGMERGGKMERLRMLMRVVIVVVVKVETCKSW